MRVRRYFQKTGKKVTISRSDTAGYDNINVECFNCHKMGHFARECRSPRNQESRPKNQDNSRKTVIVEDTSSKAMVAINGAGFDWSYMADDEVPTNMALMAFSDSEIKIDNFKNASKSLDKLIGSQITENSKTGLGFTSYNAVAPPPTGFFAPPSIDLSNSGLKEFKQPEFKEYRHKDSKNVCIYTSNKIKKAYDALIIEDWVFDSNEDESEEMVLKSDNVQHKHEQANQPRNSGIVPISTARQSSSKAATPVSVAKPINTAASKPLGAPQDALKDQGYFNSGCSRHMTGNISYLTDFKEHDGGYVAFRGGAKGGKITRKGTIRNATKDETSRIVKSFITEIENLVEKKVKIIRCDNGTEFKNRVMNGFCEKKSIKREYNAEVVNTACYVQNKTSWESLMENQMKGSLLANLQLVKLLEYTTVGLERPVNTTTPTYVDSPNDPLMPDLEDARIFDDAYDDRDEGAEADYNNLETVISVSLIPSTRIHKHHPKEHIIKEVNSAVQTMKMAKQNEAGLISFINKQRRTNHKDFQNCLFACFLSQMEPKKTLVDLPPRKRAIGAKWVYRNKRDQRGIVVRNKAWLVVQGYRQEECIDYDEFFALVARIEAINQPSSFVDPEFPDGVYKVKKALYGLHQAPKAWYETSSTYLLDNGFRRWTIDKTLFIKKIKDDILLVQVYVVDIIFGSIKRSLSASLDRQSTTKEYIDASNCYGQVLWLQNQFLDYGYNFMQTKIHVDNESAICVVKNHVYHLKTKHIEFRHHFIRDSYDKRLIEMVKIHTDYNVVDLLNKAFDVTRFQFLVASIGLELKGYLFNDGYADLVLHAGDYFNTAVVFRLGFHQHKNGHQFAMSNRQERIGYSRANDN
uniref:CCHC-type domain-containing protein n=1 Tax=Tanacetum cinerariifolium TaxID=118510 RepID=A0A6L2LTC6_TANCI|nr:hypothetical protein [Tanacetum cinerariifolium]